MIARIPISSIKKMAIAQTNRKMKLEDVIIAYGCNYAINGGLYNTLTGKPNCWLRVDGKTIKTESDGYWCYAWNIGPDIKLVHSNDIEKYQNAIACCSLAKDGKPTILKYDKGQRGTRGRTAIGIDKSNNLVLLVTKDGTADAMTPEELQTHMIKTQDCKSAIMMDSGGSSQGYFNGTRYGGPRKVANWILIWTEEPKTNPTTNIPTHTVTASSLNVRSGPGTKYGKIGSLKKGDQITVIGCYTTWCRIQYGSQLGYVSKDYITPINQKENPIIVKTVVASSLNVRSGPGTNYKKLGSLKSGDKVQVLVDGNWCKIRYGTGTGYVYKSYLK